MKLVFKGIKLHKEMLKHRVFIGHGINIVKRGLIKKKKTSSS